MSYKNENKSHFILFFAGFFVPLRMDSAGAASRHFCKNKALTIIVVFRKKPRARYQNGNMPCGIFLFGLLSYFRGCL
jgi:hypothetical protein